ncbi:hypothetical protein [Kitasatospora sp. NPDC086791]|uniref:hypothetical protein n=1 Tax=Kitasatospora sp. NPDC086791 TaxID=3155178 RepID=UPI003433A465
MFTPIELSLPRMTQFGLLVQCPGSCARSTHVTTEGWRAGYIRMHATARGVLCTGSGAAWTAEAAIARDSQLNPEERAVRDRTYAALTACRGFDTITGEPCHHPICHRRGAAS